MALSLLRTPCVLMERGTVLFAEALVFAVTWVLSCGSMESRGLKSMIQKLKKVKVSFHVITENREDKHLPGFYEEYNDATRWKSNTDWFSLPSPWNFFLEKLFQNCFAFMKMAPLQHFQGEIFKYWEKNWAFLVAYILYS